MTRQDPGAPTPRHDRTYLLGPNKRNHVLSLWEVQRYGLDSFGDAGYVSIYGLRPEEWYARGIRLLARTAVECTRDPLADLIGRDIADLARPRLSDAAVIDPFAGSGNTLYWITRHTSARAGIGFELDDAVFAASRNNLAIVGLNLTLFHDGYEAGLKALTLPADQPVIVFLAPPWGDALDDASGLDLRRTTPPIPTVIELIASTFRSREVLAAIQIHETVTESSLAEVSSHCDWSLQKTYGIDAPGKNHGLLLCTLGWVP